MFVIIIFFGVVWTYFRLRNYFFFLPEKRTDTFPNIDIKLVEQDGETK